MTSDFKPGKAYLIEGKGIEQVKSEIKDWLTEKGIEVKEEDENSLIAYNYFYSFKISQIWISLKLENHISETVITFDERVYRFQMWLIVGGQYYYLDEIRKDMVRYLKGKDEIGINTIGRYCALSYLPMLPALIFWGVPFFSGMFSIVLEESIWNLFMKLFLIFILIGNLCSMYLEFVPLRKKLDALANSYEHYIEKYSGEEYKVDIFPLIGYFFICLIFFFFIIYHI
ncbi:MAG: hypothetical protein HPY60_03895 [Candidatus Methanofastidiosum sp.]|nr:hypothetical protein [Methanofastidiosum sp.]